MGIGGLALATSISALFCTLLLFISLRKKIGHFGLKDITHSFGKIVLASIIMAIVAKLINSVLLPQLGANLSLLASIGIGAAVYFGIIYFMKIKEVEEIILQIKKEIRKVMPQE
jgi:putative peptidoglycan lipid II flippase